MQWWHVGLVASFIITGAYGAISFRVWRGLLTNHGRLRDNPLAVATGSIFATCALGHFGHLAHLAGGEAVITLAAREAFNSAHIALGEAVTAGIGIWYWSLRGRFPALVRGAAVFEDVRVRRQQALEIHDNVVQGLTAAKLSFELGRQNEAMQTLDQTLSASRRIISDLMDAKTVDVGDLRRTTAAL